MTMRQSRSERLTRWAAARSARELISAGVVLGGLGCFVFWSAWFRASRILEDLPGAVTLTVVTTVPLATLAWGALAGRRRGRPVGRAGALAFFLAAAGLLAGSVLALLLWYLVLLVVVVLWAAQ